MADITIKPPKNKTEEAALEKALAEYKLTRIDAVEAFLDGEVVQNFKSEIESLLEKGLPAGSTALGHISQLSSFLDRTRDGLSADRTVFNSIVNPPTPSADVPTADDPALTPPPPAA